MKSKLALVLMATLGSTVLVAPAQTQDKVGDVDQPKRVQTPYITETKPSTTSYVVNPVQFQNVQYQAEPDSLPALPPQANAAMGTSRRLPPGVGYSVSAGYGVQPWGSQFIPIEEANIAQEADQLARQLGEAKSDSDRDKLKTKLGEVLEKQFDRRQKRHEGEIEALEAQVKKLKDLVSKRQENRREIIGRRLEQILRESQGLGW